MRVFKLLVRRYKIQEGNMSVSIRAVILARDRAQNFRWISGSNDVWRYIPGYHASCTDDRILADNNLGQNGRSRANRSTSLHQGCRDSPVLVRLRAYPDGGGACIRIVDGRPS